MTKDGVRVLLALKMMGSVEGTATTYWVQYSTVQGKQYSIAWHGWV